MVSVASSSAVSSPVNVLGLSSSSATKQLRGAMGYTSSGLSSLATRARDADTKSTAASVVPGNGHFAVSAALGAADEVRSILSSIHSVVSQAAETDKNSSAFETLRSELQSLFTDLRSRVDSAVASATVTVNPTRGLNLASSAGSAVDAETTSGDLLTIQPQAFDAKSLGLYDISLASNADASDALNKVEAAIRLADTRRSLLADAADALTDVSILGAGAQASTSGSLVLANSIQPAIYSNANAYSRTSPRGSFIDLLA